MDETKLNQYLFAIQNAKSDNQVFAALLMIAKITKEESCDGSVKTKILEAVNPKFFSRLLKTKTVPDGCPGNIFKSVALSVLSALCVRLDTSADPVLTNNVPVFLDIVSANPSETDKEGRQLTDDTYQCLHCLCETQVGMKSLIQAGAMTVLSHIVESDFYGAEKALDIVVWISGSCGPTSWEGCESTLDSLVLFLAEEFKRKQTERKFNLCKVLVTLLDSMRLKKTNKEDSLSPSGVKTDPSWLASVCTGLQDILGNKLGSALREPALKLGSLVVELFGLNCLLPPKCKDKKLFLLISHLSFVEVRMVLEENPEKAFEKSGLLLSCYTVMESILNRLANSESDENLDVETIGQLHSAMVGALSAVIYFLHTVRENRKYMNKSLVLVTVRVLAAWLAEETSALKEEVYDLLPFLLEVGNSSVQADNSINNSRSSQCDSPRQTEGSYNANGFSGTLETNSDRDSSQVSSAEKFKEDSSFAGPSSEQTNNSESTYCRSKQSKSKKSHVTFNVQSDSGDAIYGQSLTSQQESDAVQLSNRLISLDLSDLHTQTDIFRFLLPGLCHLTADDKPRKKLIEQGFLDLLESYFIKQWEKFQRDDHNRDIQSSIVLACNIYLNLTVTEAKLVKERDTFCRVLKLILTDITRVEKEEEHLSLWIHFGTLGMLLMRSLHQKADQFITEGEMHHFFTSVINNLMNTHTARHEKTGCVTLTVSDMYTHLWEEIAETWLLRMQAVCECIPLCKSLPEVIEELDWIPGLCKLLVGVKRRGVDEETQTCMLQFLVTVCRHQKSFRHSVLQNKGLEIAQIYKSAELETLLNMY